MYESPFSVSFMDEIAEGIAKEIGEWIDDSIMKATVDAKITVDKDELVKALAYDRGQYDKGYGDGYQDGKRDARQWISVDERMPDTGWYLVRCNEWGGNIHRIALWDEREGDWTEWTDKGHDITEYVTHYMPFPEPPKDESDG